MTCPVAPFRRRRKQARRLPKKENIHQVHPFQREFFFDSGLHKTIFKIRKLVTEYPIHIHISLVGRNLVKKKSKEKWNDFFYSRADSYFLSSWNVYFSQCSERREEGEWDKIWNGEICTPNKCKHVQTFYFSFQTNEEETKISEPQHEQR